MKLLQNFGHSKVYLTANRVVQYGTQYGTEYNKKLASTSKSQVRKVFNGVEDELVLHLYVHAGEPLPRCVVSSGYHARIRRGRIQLGCCTFSKRSTEILKKWSRK